MRLRRYALTLTILAVSAATWADGVLGYYMSPTIHGDTVIFTAEGDLWKVGVDGGLASRITTHPAVETEAHISPDGKWIAFTASYEGPRDLYMMPIDGGVPQRCTYGAMSHTIGWTKDGKILYITSHHSLLPSYQLFTYNPATHAHVEFPLAEASDGTFAPDGALFFTRYSFQGSHTKRYKGGTAQNIWRWEGGNSEAKPLTADYLGTSRNPMYWNGRIYFESDRDGVMNIWSMDESGHNLKQHTFCRDYDVQSASLGDGRIVYQCGADIYCLNVSTGDDRLIPIRIASDFDQMREHWVTTPMEWLTAAHLSPDGSKVVLTARGQVFVMPVKTGRKVEVTRNKSVRYRAARFMPDGKSLVALSDESGEVELWKLPALGDGAGAPEQLTHDSTIMQWTAQPSPDGKWIAHTDKNLALYVYDTIAKTDSKIAESDQSNIQDLTWSPDSRYLAFVEDASNTFSQIRIYDTTSGKTSDLTTNRYNSGSPAFTSDGKYIYFVSDRNLTSSVGSPWGSRQPEPYFDKQDLVYYVSLQKGLHSPWEPADELVPTSKPAPKGGAAAEKPAALAAIDFDGLEDRIEQAPIAPGNYREVAVCGDHLYLLSAPSGRGPGALISVPIRDRNVKVDTILPSTNGFEVTPDGKKIMTNSGGALLVFDANGAPPDQAESRVDLSGWSFSFEPKEEWMEMFNEAWRLHRDYLYDPHMQGVNWAAVKKKYQPLAERVTDRDELSDVLGQMVGEVSVLHTFVFGGDARPGTDNVGVATLGAEWVKDPVAGGYRITKIYRNDPDDPELRSPLLKPGVDLTEGDVITSVDGVGLLSVDNPLELFRAKAGQEMRIHVLPAGIAANARDAIVTPIDAGKDAQLRYADWEYSRRQTVEREGQGKLGYVHLQAMGSGDVARWARDFYPVFDREGLIVDVRHNQGGNIDSWILEKLLRKAWMYWNPRKGAPTWNMQYAFRGKVVVLCDAWTSSDGEAFSEGFRRLGLGKVLGTRTWGGEVWLSSDNILVDNGIATAAETGVYGPEGKWLVEGHGVDPDVVVDNLPHATYEGADAQLEAAIKYLQEQIAEHPITVPPPPPFPNKSFEPPPVVKH